MMLRSARLSLVIGLALLLVVLALAGMQVAKAQPQTAVYFDNGGDRMVVAENGVVQFQDNGSLSILAQSYAPATNTTVVSKIGRLALSPATTVTLALTSTGYTEGDRLQFYNTSATYPVTIADGTTAKLAGNWVGGQYDMLSVWFDGTVWVEENRANN